MFATPQTAYNTTTPAALRRAWGPFREGTDTGWGSRVPRSLLCGLPAPEPSATAIADACNVLVFRSFSLAASASLTRRSHELSAVKYPHTSGSPHWPDCTENVCKFRAYLGLGEGWVGRAAPPCSRGARGARAGVCRRRRRLGKVRGAAPAVATCAASSWASWKLAERLLRGSAECIMT